VTGVAFAASKHETKKYTATAALVFSESQASQQAAGLQPVGTNISQQAVQSTNVKLVQLGDMAEVTAKTLGKGLTQADVLDSLSVSAQGESSIVNVSATSTSPTLAAEIANTYTNQFVSEQQNKNHAYYSSALALVEKQLAALSPQERVGSEGVALQSRAQSLGVLAELRSGKVQVAQAATVPTSPSSPDIKRSTILGLLLGLVLGLAVAFLIERFDRRIREPKDLEAIYGLPLLGVVPESRALARTGRRREVGREALPASEGEAFHMIRAHLRYFNVDRELKTLLVTSAAPGDGKTTVAAHLAAAAARMGSSVLLLEADLRRPTVAKKLGILAGPGVSDVLIDSVALWDATQSVDVDPVSDRGQGRTFDVLVAGAVPPPNPNELIESHAMEALLEQAKAMYNLIVIDTSPLAAVSDAFPLLRKVDGVIIVGRIGRNRRDVAERLHATLAGVGAPLLGVIANGLRTGGLGSYSYSYDYSYKQDEPDADATALSRNGAHPTEESVSGPEPAGSSSRP
jgi:capsular exopolysaccharide synthesis family protein